jgi:hypothetical protein
VAELEMDLRRLQAGEPVVAHSTDTTYLAGKFVRRNAWALAAVVTVLVSIGTAALVR